MKNENKTKRMNKNEKTDGRRNSKIRFKEAQLLVFQLEGGGALRTNVFRLGLEG